MTDSEAQLIQPASDTMFDRLAAAISLGGARLGDLWTTNPTLEPWLASPLDVHAGHEPARAGLAALAGPIRGATVRFLDRTAQQVSDDSVLIRARLHISGADAPAGALVFAVGVADPDDQWRFVYIHLVL